MKWVSTGPPNLQLGQPLIHPRLQPGDKGGSLKSITVLTVSFDELSAFGAVVETVETVPHSLSATDPKLKLGENEKKRTLAI